MSNIVERQRYTTINKLTPISKKKANNDNMIVIEDEPNSSPKTSRKNRKTKPNQ